MSLQTVRKTQVDFCRSSHKKPTKLYHTVSRRVGKALREYEMIKDGDRVIVAVSGGKDSLALLEMLRYRQCFSPVRYELVVVFVDMDVPNFPREDLRTYLQEIGVPYFFEQADIVQDGTWDDVECYHCSQLRRKRLFQAAEREGCSKIALGHHMDDIAETILLNMCFRGDIAAMCPRQDLFSGRLSLIRPLAYIQEREIMTLSEQGWFPILPDHACPNDQQSQRVVLKEIIQRLEKENPVVKKNIIGSLRRIKKDYLP
ncbi:MAG: ATP-binding protein [Candidatus Omnitrophota bacterium]